MKGGKELFLAIHKAIHCIYKWRYDDEKQMYLAIISIEMDLKMCLLTICLETIRPLILEIWVDLQVGVCSNTRGGVRRIEGHVERTKLGIRFTLIKTPSIPNIGQVSRKDNHSPSTINLVELSIDIQIRHRFSVRPMSASPRECVMWSASHVWVK